VISVGKKGRTGLVIIARMAASPLFSVLK